MIQVHTYTRFPFEYTRETTVLEHRPGMTVRDAMPQGETWWLEKVVLSVDGEQAHLDQVLLDGALVTAASLAQGLAAAQLAFAAVFLVGYNMAQLSIAKRTKDRGEDKSAVYGFSGITNTRVEGQPMPIHYGKIRSGGQILNEFVRVNNTDGSSSYHVLISYGPGPIRAIGNQEVDTPKAEPLLGDDLIGVYLNDNPFQNLSDVRAWVRLGTYEQDPVPGFEEIEISQSVDIELEQELGSGNLFDPENGYGTTATDQAWSDYGVSFDLDDDDYDGARVQVQFPYGLFKLNSDGEANAKKAYVAVRYIELDGGGTPITTGGTNGNGYVYLRPSLIQSSAQSNFYFERALSFVDPQTLSLSAGNAVELDGSNDYLEVSSPSLPAGFDNGFTVTGWAFNADSNAARHALFSWGGANGFDFYIQFLASNSDGTGWPAVRVAGTGERLSESSGATIHFDRWVHYAFVYDTTTDGLNTPSVKVYADGILHAEASGEEWRINGGASDFRLGLAYNAWGGTFEGKYDEWAVYSRPLSSYDIAQLYNSGEGSYAVSQEQLVSHWHFESKVSGSYADEGIYSNAMVAQPTSGDTGTATGHVPVLVNGSSKRGTYRVEALRVDRKSDSSRVQEASIYLNCVGVIDEQFSYPGQAVLGLVVEGTEQINTTPPTVSADIRGRLVPVWTQESATSPQFNMEWSDNPAWVATDMILDSSFGAGVYFEGKNIDLPAFNELAAECGEFIPDNYPAVADAVTEWSDMRYSVGELVVLFADSDLIPPHWTPDSSVAFFDAFPTPAANPGVVLVDLNYSTGDLGKYGFRIKRIEGVSVYLEYPFLEYGAPWAEDSFLNFSLGVTISGTIKGVEPRWAFNGVFDTARGFWDSLQSALIVGQAVPVRVGNRIGLLIDNQRSAVAQVSMGSTIVEEGGRSTFEYGYVSKLRQPNRIELDILDARQDFSQRSAAFSDPDIDNSANAAELRTESREGFGITSYSQAMRAARFIVLKAKSVRHRGGYSSGPESLHLQPGDVTLVSHDLIPRGTGGRLRGASSTTVVQLDQGVTILPATVYKLKLRDPATNVFETKTVTSASGGYNPGADITVDTGFSGVPAKDTEYVFYEDGTLLLGEVVGRRLDPKTLISDIEWREYPSSIYGADLDTLPTDTISLAATTGGQGPRIGDLTVPGDVHRITLRDFVVEESQIGQASRDLLVSWVLDPDTARIVTETRVYARVQGSSWSHVATVDSGPHEARFRIKAGFGSVLEVAVQPWSRGGVRRPVDRCSRALLTVSARGEAPEPPAGLSAVLDGTTAVYSWTLPANRRDLRVELRRGGPGGWKLLPVIGISSRGATELRTDDWANVPNNAAGEYPSPTVVARTIGPAGEYSSPVEVAFSPTAIGSSPRTDSSYLAAAWEDFGDGWLVDSTPPAGNPVLTDLVRNSDGDLEFTGSSLTARYKAGEPTYPAQGIRAERHHIEAVLDAVQLHPQTIADFPAYGLDDPRLAHWTLEGPLTAHGSESQGCTSKIQWRVVTEAGGSWGSWQDYQPCVASIVSAQFRVLFTRPSTDYQIRVRSFRTRLTRIAPQRFERSPQHAFLRDRFLRHG